MLPPTIFASSQFRAANLVTATRVRRPRRGVLPARGTAAERSSATRRSRGAATFPITILMLALSARSGALAARIGPRLQMTVGPLLVAAGMVLMTRIDAGGDLRGCGPARRRGDRPRAGHHGARPRPRCRRPRTASRACASGVTPRSPCRLAGGRRRPLLAAGITSATYLVPAELSDGFRTAMVIHPGAGRPRRVDRLPRGSPRGAPEEERGARGRHPVVLRRRGHPLDSLPPARGAAEGDADRAALVPRAGNARDPLAGGPVGSRRWNVTDADMVDAGRPIEFPGHSCHESTEPGVRTAARSSRGRLPGTPPDPPRCAWSRCGRMPTSRGVNLRPRYRRAPRSAWRCCASMRPGGGGEEPDDDSSGVRAPSAPTARSRGAPARPGRVQRAGGDRAPRDAAVRG